MEPSLNLSIQDREMNLELEIKIQEVSDRCEMLELALFKKKGPHSRTIFDEYSEKLSEMNVFLKQETKLLQDTLQGN